MKGLCPSFGFSKKSYGNWTCYRLQVRGGGTPTLLGSLEELTRPFLALLRLALSKEPNRVGVSLPSPEDGNRSSFRNFVFCYYLEFRTMNKVQKPSHSECYTPLSEPFRRYNCPELQGGRWSFLFLFIYLFNLSSPVSIPIKPLPFRH
jgi:hypothetical protein